MHDDQFSLVACGTIQGHGSWRNANYVDLQLASGVVVSASGLVCTRILVNRRNLVWLIQGLREDCSLQVLIDQGFITV